jgi:hypothetical protein
MANLTNASVSITSTISGQQFAGAQQIQTAPAGVAACKTIQSIATSSTQIVLEVTGNPAYLLIINEDPTNYVEVDSVNTFNNFPQKILAGGFIVLSPETATVYAKANTGAVLITVLALPV